MFVSNSEYYKLKIRNHMIYTLQSVRNENVYLQLFNFWVRLQFVTFANQKVITDVFSINLIMDLLFNLIQKSVYFQNNTWDKCFTNV